MVIEEGILNVSNFVMALPPQVLARVEGLLLLFKAVGIAVIVYIIYLFISGFLIFRRMKRMKFIEKKVVDIDKKLNRLLKKNKK